MKVKVKFISTVSVKDENDAITETYEADKTYTLEAASAKRWVRRGKAEFVNPEDAEAVEAEIAKASFAASDSGSTKGEARKIVDAAKAEAAKIIEAAKAEAMKIIDAANVDAAKIIDGAKQLS